MRRMNSKTKRRVAGILAILLIAVMVLSSVSFIFVGDMAVFALPML